jgi:hypothetical protein
MSIGLRVFISYRRRDSFMRHAQTGELDTSFIETLKAAFVAAKFEHVFIDKDKQEGILSAEDFESKIHNEITECDLFVELIGKDWASILQQHIADAKADPKKTSPDILVREIRDAIALEKEIVPILVDGAMMPPRGILPKAIHRLTSRNAISTASDTPVDALVPEFVRLQQRILSRRILGQGWRRNYIDAALVAYSICAIFPHVIGMLEYGRTAWIGMALIWSGFFLWPVLFLPLALIALYRPITTVAQFAASAPRPGERLRYLTPLILATGLAFLATLVEVISPDQVPWTIRPSLPQPGCFSGPPSPQSPLADLSSYDSTKALENHYADAFWLKDKCWPNALFYLTIPVYERKAPEAYRTERRDRIQPAFVRVLKTEYGAPFSWSYFVYGASFFILIWLCAAGIVLSVFYFISSIRRPDDGSVLNTPSEDANLCLAYSLITLMIWIPFRMNTVYIKSLYLCADINECGALSGGLEPKAYIRDIMLLLTLLIGYLFLTSRLLVRYRRISAALLGAAILILIIASGAAMMRYSAEVANLASEWYVPVGFSIPVIVLLYALWSQFDPTVVRFNDFRREIE